MKDVETKRLLNRIGEILAEDTVYPLDGTLLYARLDRAWVAPSIFKNLGNQILYRRPDLDRLGDALLALWEAQDSNDRWAEIEYLLRDGHFHVTYTYPDAIDPDEEPMDRRARVVRAHFGDKPMVYPPWPPPENGLDYEL